MNTMKINEQIAFLRKQKGLTQGELADALGITNQSVSKWESAQCCPDIQLLPSIAELFNVSVDKLIGYTPASTSEDIVLALRKKIETLPKGEDSDFTFHIAAALHTIILSKEAPTDFNTDPGQNTNRTDQTGWGYSCCHVPEITTTMRHNAVFFSNNQNPDQIKIDIPNVLSIIKPFSDAKNLKTAAAIYQLTVHSKKAYTTIGQLSEKSGLPEEQIRDCLTNGLAPFLSEKEGTESMFRFKGMYMNIIPILSLFDIKSPSIISLLHLK